MHKPYAMQWNGVRSEKPKYEVAERRKEKRKCTHDEQEREREWVSDSESKRSRARERITIIMCGELDTSVQTDHVLYAVFLPIYMWWLCGTRSLMRMVCSVLCCVVLCTIYQMRLMNVSLLFSIFSLFAKREYNLPKQKRQRQQQHFWYAFIKRNAVDTHNPIHATRDIAREPGAHIICVYLYIQQLCIE